MLHMLPHDHVTPNNEPKQGLVQVVCKHIKCGKLITKKNTHIQEGVGSITIGRHVYFPLKIIYSES
jgi:hypothetical protein